MFCISAEVDNQVDQYRVSKDLLTRISEMKEILRFITVWYSILTIWHPVHRDGLPGGNDTPMFRAPKRPSEGVVEDATAA